MHISRYTNNQLLHTVLHQYHQHSCHVVKLLHKAVNVLHTHTANGSYTTLTRTFDDFWLSALFHRHRVDDGFHTHQHFIVHLRLNIIRDLPHARQLAHQASHAAHIFHLAQLLKKIVEIDRKSVV